MNKKYLYILIPIFILDILIFDNPLMKFTEQIIIISIISIIIYYVIKLLKHK